MIFESEMNYNYDVLFTTLEGPKVIPLGGPIASAEINPAGSTCQLRLGPFKGSRLDPEDEERSCADENPLRLDGVG
jgi:hypothetical protein